jgi:hypothetical protein
MLGRAKQQEYLAEAAAGQRFERLAKSLPAHLPRKLLITFLITFGCLIPVAVMVARLFAA